MILKLICHLHVTNDFNPVMNFSFLGRYSTQTTMANTTVCGNLEDQSFPIKLVKILCYSLILITSLLGNTAIIAITARNSRTLTSINYLIANMAASDLLVSIFAVPNQLCQVIFGERAWLIDGIMGSVLCKLVFFCQDISTAVSIQSLVVISMERYRAIVYPFRPAVITPKRCKFIIPLIWLASVSLHGIYFYAARLESINNTTICDFRWEPQFDNRQTMERYVAVVLVLIVFLPFCFTIFTYSRILWVLRNSEVSQHRAENSRVFKNVCAIMIAFACCVLPIDIFAILFYFVWKWKPPCNMIQFGVFSRFALISNSAISPIISLVRFDRYRQGLKDMFKTVSKHFWGKDGVGNISNLDELELKKASIHCGNERISVRDSGITSFSSVWTFVCLRNNMEFDSNTESFQKYKIPFLVLFLKESLDSFTWTALCGHLYERLTF